MSATDILYAYKKMCTWLDLFFAQYCNAGVKLFISMSVTDWSKINTLLFFRISRVCSLENITWFDDLNAERLLQVSFL